MIDSQFPQDSNQHPYSMFQVPQQEEELMDADRSMKNLIHSENNFNQSVNRLEAQMSHLLNIIIQKNEKILPNTCSIIPYCPAILIIMKNHGVLEILTKS